MTKFGDVEDPGFIAVTGELRRWIKSISQSQIVDQSPYRSAGNGDHQGSSGYRTLTITQGSPQFHGPTTVSGGSVFQGNFVGRNTSF